MTPIPSITTPRSVLPLPNPQPTRFDGSTEPRIIGPRDGTFVDLHSVGVRFMTWGAESGDGFSLVEHPIPPRTLVAPLHRHEREDEYSYVLEGCMGAVLGDDVVYAEPGDLVFKPRRQWHTFWNAGDTPCRILEIISPAGFERFFAELGDAMEAARAPSPAAVFPGSDLPERLGNGLTASGRQAIGSLAESKPARTRGARIACGRRVAQPCPIRARNIVCPWAASRRAMACLRRPRQSRHFKETERMKNVSRALLLLAALTGGSAAQAPSRRAPGPAVKIAVVEFTPAANAAGMTANAKRWLQAQLSATLHDTRRFDVYDTRHTRDASQSTLSAINHDSSTAAAVKVGKQLGVRYVLTGTVTQYTAQGDGDFGYTTLRTRLVDVAAGRVHHAGETVQKGTGVMRTTGEAEMHAKVMKPAIDALSATLLTTLPTTP